MFWGADDEDYHSSAEGIWESAQEMAYPDRIDVLEVRRGISLPNAFLAEVDGAVRTFATEADARAARTAAGGEA